MKNSTLLKILNNTNAETSTLSAIKYALTEWAEEKVDVGNYKPRQIMHENALKDDKLSFEGFVDLLGFTIFHTLVENERLDEGDRVGSFKELENEMVILTERAKGIQVKIVNEFTKTLLDEIGEIITMMGHHISMIEMNSETAQEIINQANELKNESKS